MKKIFYIIGQPGSGKTSIANLLCNHLKDVVFHIDGDELRTIFKNNDYSDDGRKTNIKRAHDIARFVSAKDIYTVISLVSPYRELREEFKQNNYVFEIYLHSTDDRGKAQYHVNDYEPPVDNFMDIDTTNLTPQESLNLILSKI